MLWTIYQNYFNYQWEFHDLYCQAQLQILRPNLNSQSLFKPSKIKVAQCGLALKLCCNWPNHTKTQPKHQLFGSNRSPRCHNVWEFNFFSISISTTFKICFTNQINNQTLLGFQWSWHSKLQGMSYDKSRQCWHSKFSSSLELMYCLFCLSFSYVHTYESLHTLSLGFNIFKPRCTINI